MITLGIPTRRRVPTVLDADATLDEIADAVIVVVDGRVIKHRYGDSKGTTLVTYDGRVIYRPRRAS